MARWNIGAWTAVALSISLLACSSGRQRPAPVADWSKTKKAASAAAASDTPAHPAADAAARSASDAAAAEQSVTEPVTRRAPVGVENAGKPGYYTVQKGDTLIRIGLDAGQNYRDIARWNAIENPNKIEIGDVYRVIPPEEPVVAKAVVSSRLSPTPLPPVTSAAATAPKAVGPAVPASSAAASGVSAALKAAPATAQAAEPVAVAPAPPKSAVDDTLEFAWPAKGEVIAGFDEAKNRKGIDLAGGAGDSVLAAAEGKVVYAGEGLRGYGKLIIIKHNNTFLTAYAHNQTILVKEDQSVKKGQKIAEMGSSDSDRVKLHFEIRERGRPVDPMKYLRLR
ncbi:MAG: LysM peptidoglycan-binding domain-containing protein [Betaproteobacteria bacterium]|nr:LysM peptidoglycan-binding domain-containing protein [Betaproteobacteria bacterium]